MEQDLQLRKLHDQVQLNYFTNKNDVITILMALQRQNYVLGNSITNLVQKWPTPPPIPSDPTTIKGVRQMFGTLLGTKD